MQTEINAISASLQATLTGEPWYGQNVIQILSGVDAASVYEKPNEQSHSLIELLYHMNTWAEFVLSRLQNDAEKDLGWFETMDWRIIDPHEHSWQEGLKQFKEMNERIIKLIGNRDDSFLDDPVSGRNYNFRFLLYGIIQHNIYHAGQVAYVKKLLG